MIVLATYPPGYFHFQRTSDAAPTKLTASEQVYFQRPLLPEEVSQSYLKDNKERYTKVIHIKPIVIFDIDGRSPVHVCV